MTKRDELAETYTKNTSGEALFSTNLSGDPEFRFELIDVGWELSDGDRIGKVVNGTFYFSDDLDQTLATIDGGYYVDQVTESDVVYALISFYKPGSTSDKLGEFLARDPDHVIAGSGLYQENDRSGLWQKTNYARSTAVVNKSAFSTEFTMNCPSLDKKATFHCDQSDEKLYKSAVQNVKGNLNVLDINHINDAKTVKWTALDLVFYPDSSATALSAFFSVGNNQANQLGEDDTTEIQFDGVTWGPADK